MEICWYMKGSVSWEEAWQLTFTDRRMMVKHIEKQLEMEAKRGRL